MGQHNHNPTAQLAKEGKLPKKPAKMGKRESDRLLYAEIQSHVFSRLLRRSNREVNGGAD